jgi:peptidoglycan-N-acetylglucosamine deacetylase
MTPTPLDAAVGEVSAPRHFSVCLSFDFDALSVWIAGSLLPPGAAEPVGPVALSRGEFGAYALPRILELLERYRARSTFFVPGHTAVAYPDHARMIRDHGHEIGHHGWVHEAPAGLDLAQEREMFERGFEALDRVCGVRPIGYRSPGEFSASTVSLLAEYGFRYDSSCLGRDFTPYRLRSGDAWNTSEPFRFGTETNVVEVPWSWHLDDFPYFEHVPGFSTRLASVEHVYTAWLEEFHYGYDHHDGGVIVFTMHPQVIGRGPRLRMLERLLDHIRGCPGAVFEPVCDVALRFAASAERA